MPFRLVLFPDLLGMKAANLKDVFESRFEVERQRQLVGLNVVVINGDYVVYGQFFCVDNALQVQTKGLDGHGLSARNVQLLVCELEFGNRAPVCGRHQNVRRSARKSYTVAIEVPAIVVVKAEAVLIVGGKLAILLGKEENVTRFGYDGPCNIPRRSRRVMILSHIVSRYIFLMRITRAW
jgi:hypothetical protein